MTLGKVCFAECLLCGARHRTSLPSAIRWLSAKTDGRQLWDGRWRPFAESPLCREFDTRQSCLCRVSPYAECSALGKARFAECLALPSAALGKALFAECPTKDTRQRIQHSAKPAIPVVHSYFKLICRMPIDGQMAGPGTSCRPADYVGPAHQPIWLNQRKMLKMVQEVRFKPMPWWKKGRRHRVKLSNQ
jgi:hypothetical protein